MTYQPENAGSSGLSDAELRLLGEAAHYLESPTFLIKIANLAGKPAEALLASLPQRVRLLIADATSEALRKGLDWAVKSLAEEKAAHDAARVADLAERLEKHRAENGTGKPVKTNVLAQHATALIETTQEFLLSARASSFGQFIGRHRHTALTALTGAGGGMLGLPGLAVELPATTLLMLRSIASIAAEHGADLGDPATRLECLAVFSLGSQPLEDMESAYFTTRLSLAMGVRQSSHFVATHSAREISDALARGSAPMLMRFINSIAARFQVVVSEKIAAQAVPLVGAGCGAVVNAAFTDHFNRVANYHFAIVAMERQHGRDVVQAAYEQACRARSANSKLRPLYGPQPTSN